MASTFMCGVEDFLISGSRFVWDLTITTLRKWYTERLRHCQHVVRTWCGLGDVYQVHQDFGFIKLLLEIQSLDFFFFNDTKVCTKKLNDLSRKRGLLENYWYSVQKSLFFIWHIYIIYYVN